MIVEPVPTNPRSPVRRVIRVVGMAAPAALLVAVVTAGVLGPRAEPAPTSRPPAPATVDTAPPATAPAPTSTPAPWLAVDAPPASFTGLRPKPIQDVVAAHAASVTQGLVALDGWLSIAEARPQCDPLPQGALGPWCRRAGMLVAEPWTGESANSRPLAPHVRVTIPLGVMLPGAVRAGSDSAPLRVLLLGRFEREGAPCDSAGWGACESGFIVDRIAYSAGDRVGLTTLIAPGLDRERRANPLERIAAPDIPLLAVYARPAIIVAVDPATASLTSRPAPGTSPRAGPAAWYVRWYSATSHEVRWRLLDGATLAPLGEGVVGPTVVNAEQAPVQAR